MRDCQDRNVLSRRWSTTLILSLGRLLFWFIVIIYYTLSRYIYIRTEVVVVCLAGGAQLLLLETHLRCRTKSPVVYRSTNAHCSHISTVYQVC